MKIRIISNVMYKSDRVFSPGLVMDMDEEQALAWIEEGKAIPFEDEPEAKPKQRKAAKEVSNGNG